MRLHRSAGFAVVAAALLAGCRAGDTAQTAPSPTTSLPAGSGSLTPSAASPAASAASPSARAAQPTITVTVRGNRVTPPPRTVRVKLGSTVRLAVMADRDEEVHVHGYDLKRAVSRGQTVTLQFRADIPGRFEVELEQEGTRLLVLQVS